MDNWMVSRMVTEMAVMMVGLMDDELVLKSVLRMVASRDIQSVRMMEHCSVLKKATCSDLMLVDKMERLMVFS